MAGSEGLTVGTRLAKKVQLKNPDALFTQQRVGT